jgi:hypothetical protein
MNRIRIGFFMTILLGAMWASAGLFQPTDNQFLTGVVVCMLGVVGFGAVDWIER